ncbi:hypothetical protein I9018_19570 [Pseudomonas sp. MPFS]|uniref:hypothetical protein n=1 Tax=Pseudomonas sp. MPFS TaxID=2795724 RepID=UPI001F1484CD|nr:hypothetical protein [Pseudomonas sp. MPFS]UMZ09715.1 hypothetical protein I9018_19570 [Pseudomonas sp. MPFS]
MEAGLTIYNDTDNIQIDSTYKNLILYAKGTAVTTTSFVGTSLSYVDILATRPNSVCCMQSVGGAAFSCISFESGGNVYHRIFTKRTGQSVKYYLFSDQIPGGSTFGLEVYDANGFRVFQATEKYMVITAAVTSFKLIEATGIQLSQTIGAGSRAISISNRVLGKRTVAIPTPTGTIIYAFSRFITMCTTREGFADFEYFQYASGTGSVGYEGPYELSALSIDLDRVE